MSYLLDSNACSVYIRGKSPKLRNRLEAIPIAALSLCSIVRAELLYGAWHSPHQSAAMMRLRSFFARIPASPPFDDAAAEIYGERLASLSTAGIRIGTNDLMIASIALANHLTLVTHNTAEFSRIKDLRLEDWEA